MKKTNLLLALCLLATQFTHAQFYKTILPAPDSFTDSLERIVEDFRYNFYPIQGRQLVSEGMVDIYQSNRGIPGAAHCTIQRYHSEEDTTASWQAVMYDGESFDEALKVYKKTFKHIKKAKIKSAERSQYSFSGNLEVPTESVRFTVTPLRLNTTDPEYKYFYAVVEINNNYDGWVVHLNLHSRKDDQEKY